MNEKTQIYSIPTSEDDQAFFIPGLVIQSSIRLNDHMNPLQLFQYDKKSEEILKTLKKSS